MLNTPKWRIVPGVRLHWRSWEDEFVVYDSDSGDTHLLNQVSGDILKVLESESPTISDLAVRLAESQKVQPDGELSAYLERLLAKLERLGLIERIQK